MSSRKRSRGGRRLAPLLLLAVAVVAVAALLVLRQRRQPPPADAVASPSAAQPEAPAEGRVPSYPELPEPSEEPGSGRTGTGSASAARAALVIDDLGRSVAEVEALAGLGVPISYAVLPFETRTPEVVAAVRRVGGELLCHLPMQPDRAANPEANPGPGALTRAMDRHQLAAATGAALDAVPGAVGVNNHMGSELSADRSAMRSVLEVVGERRLFYLDSRTSAATVGYETARNLGIATAERQVFLDGDPDPRAIREQFARLVEIARQRGAAIAIGHPYPSTLEVLRQEIPRAVEAGIQFVPVSYLLDRAAEPLE